MRWAILCAMLLLPCMQVPAAASPSQAAAPIVPVLALTISPTQATANSSTESSVSVRFDGTAMVDKPPIVRCVVTLNSATDVGWVSQVTPTSMVFTSTAPQSFTVTVVIPQGTPSMQGRLLVNGRAVAAGLQSLAEVSAIIDVTGPASLNLTAQNRTQANATRAAGALGGGGPGLLTISMLAVVLVAVPAGAYAFLRHRRMRLAGHPQ